MREYVYEALLGLLRAKGLSPEAAKIEAARRLDAAVARATPILGNRLKSIDAWREVAVDLRGWLA